MDQQCFLNLSGSLVSSFRWCESLPQWVGGAPPSTWTWNTEVAHHCHATCLDGWMPGGQPWRSDRPRSYNYIYAKTDSGQKVSNPSAILYTETYRLDTSYQRRGRVCNFAFHLVCITEYKRYHIIVFNALSRPTIIYKYHWVLQRPNNAKFSKADVSRISNIIQV